MQFITSLFGGTENSFLTAALALGIVLVLIVLGVWALKVFFSASNKLVRGRNRRLTVIDSVMIDSKRSLIIVRRDSVEHLILTGGPQDLVVESGIPAERPVGGQTRRGPGEGPGAGASGQFTAVAGATPEAGPAGVARAALASAPAATGAMDRLREMARSGAQRGAMSLRHTGLMRPISRMEPAAVIPINPDNSEHRRVDSAKTGAQRDFGGQAAIGGDRHPADSAKAEGS